MKKKVKFLHRTILFGTPSRAVEPGEVIEVQEGDALNAWLAQGIVEITK